MRKRTSKSDAAATSNDVASDQPEQPPVATVAAATADATGVSAAIYADHPQYAPAHYTAGLLPEVREQYERAYRDPQLLSIRDNIALLQARRVQMVGRIKLGDSTEWRKDLLAAWGDVLAAHKTDDDDAKREALKAMTGLMKSGGADDDVWKDVQDIDRDLVKWKKLEHDRLNDLRVVMTLAEAAYKLHLYHTAVLEIVTDDRDRAALELRRREVFQAAGG